MNKINVYNSAGEVVKEVKLNPKIFNIEINLGLIQQVAEAQLANARQVLAHTKNRGDVRGGGIKPWRQKGTGRARHGSIRSPLWVGGGVTFGPRKDRNYSKKVNKKMKKKALFMCLTDKVQSNLLVPLDTLKIDTPKTKSLLDILKKLPTLETKTKRVKVPGKDKKVEIKKKEIKEIAKTLIVMPDKVDKVYLSSRNLKKVEVVRADSLNIVDILKYKYLVMPIDSLKVIEKTYLSPEGKKTKNQKNNLNTK
jgi:large subunit ribosomal protein L4